MRCLFVQLSHLLTSVKHNIEKNRLDGGFFFFVLLFFYFSLSVCLFQHHFWKMMKIFIVVAIVAIVACAGEYTYKLPEHPCAYEMKFLTKQNGGKAKESTTYAINDHFLYAKINMDSNPDNFTYYIYRPDITKNEGEREKIGLVVIEGDVCTVDFDSLAEYTRSLDDLYSGLFHELNNTTWENKKNTEYDDQKCVVYYDDDIDVGALFVLDGFPFVYRHGETDYIVQWNWDVPLSKFKHEGCEEEFTKTPSAKYSKCSTTESSSTDVASSIQAVSAVVFAVIAASLVSLF